MAFPITLGFTSKDDLVAYFLFNETRRIPWASRKTRLIKGLPSYSMA